MRWFSFFVLAAGIFCGVCFGDLNSGLVCRWEFEGDFRDIAGGNNAAAWGDPVFAEGMKGASVELDGAGDYLTAQQVVRHTPFSIACWVRPADTGTGRTIICTKEITGDLLELTSTGYALSVDYADKIVFAVAIGDAQPFEPHWEEVTSLSAIPQDEWTHLVVVVNDRSAGIYIDGVEQGYRTFSEDCSLGENSPLLIGADSDSESNIINHFAGRLDDLRIYGRELNEYEINELRVLPIPVEAPVPADGASRVSIDSDLSWADPGAESFPVFFNYIVHFGTTNPPTEIVDRHPSSFRSYPLDRLGHETTYYWKVDRETDSITIPGEVWSFTTIGGKATAPLPEIGAAPVELDIELSWTPYANAISHTVCFGRTSSTRTVLVENTTKTSIDPGPLEYGTTYYWRVDETNATGKVIGDVWRFTTRYEDGRTLSVDDDGPAMFSKIQAAIDVAGNDYTIIVKKGRYVENLNMRGKAITLRSSDPADGSVVAETIIDGGQVSSVIRCVSGEGANTVIDGFVITNGRGTAVEGSIYGGGMYNRSSSPTVTNCTFTRNDNSIGRGGGMYNRDSSPTVSNCLFVGNWGGVSGGGMYNRDSDPTVINCTFSGNASLNAPGGMRNWGSSPTVINCRFIGNAGGEYPWKWATGMSNWDSSLPKIIDSCFCENSAQAIDGDWIDGGGNNLEFCPPPREIIEGDLTGDGKVNMADLAVLAENWLAGV